MSVVVCAYTEERWSDLCRALESVAEQRPPPLEIILVVDHAPALYVRARAEIEGVRVVENGEDRGLSGARNTGIAVASGDVVAFLDDDAYAEPGWLSELIAPYRDPSIMGTGGSAEAEWDAPRPSWFPREFDWVVGCSYVGMPETMAPVRNPLGCNMSFRRTVFAEVGGFREEVGRVGQLPSGCEETELCIRVARIATNDPIILVPRARVHHHVPARRGTLGYFTARCYHEGRSKAVVSRLAGAKEGLSSERAYVLHALPRGVATGLRDLMRGDPGGVRRAAAILYGLGVTSAGYAAGRVLIALRSFARGRGRDAVATTAPLPRDLATLPSMAMTSSVAAGREWTAPSQKMKHDIARLVPPVRIAEIELSRPLPSLDGDRDTTTNRSWLLFVRLHGAPLGTIQLEVPPAGLSPVGVAMTIAGRLGTPIMDHLRADGLDAGRLLGPGGIDGPAPCSDALATFASTAPPLTVAIPTRDRAERVVACIDSVLATGYPRLEVLVVDNAPSSDATKRLMAERYATVPWVRYVGTDRAGTARARNVALRLASSEIVAFLDDDVLVDPAWAAAIARPFAVDDRVGCVTGMIFAAELETWPQVWIEEYGGFGKGFEPRRFDLGAPPADDRLFPFTAGRFGSGANAAFRLSALRAVGGFDTALGPGTAARGGEDLAAFVDIVLDGWQIAYEPRAVVRHFHHREYDRLRRVMFGYGAGLGGYLGRLAVKHPSRIPGVAGRAAYGTAYLLDPRSKKNARKRPGYPRELTRLELAGLVLGPFAYAAGRSAARSFRRRSRGAARGQR